LGEMVKCLREVERVGKVVEDVEGVRGMFQDV
jgi:hypothetical protein